MPVSAVDCIQPAIQHAREQLFKPFRWGQWFRLALVGILAAEVHSGGCSIPNFNNFPITHPRQGGNGFLPPGFPHIDPSRIAQFAGLIAVAILLAIILFFVFLYISSVFRFILFDSVLRRECAIGEGWNRWRRAGRRFFLWQLVFQISVGLFFVVLAGISLAVAAAAGWMRDPGHHVAGVVVGVILLIGVFLIFALAAAVVQVLAKDFLVPLMALENLDFADGWSRLLAMIRPEPGKYAVYLLLKLVLGIAAAILFGLISIIPALVLVIPGVVVVLLGRAAGLGWNVTTISLAVIFGTLLVLALIYVIAWVSVPATVFFPAYSIYFFASRYPKLDALLHPAPPAPELPPLPETPPPEAPPLPPAPEPIG
ncbi:MAG: hypothetical protein ACHP7J_04790 [Terriglobales bacterium]